MTLRFAHFAAEDHPAHIAAKEFASRIEARTQGAIKITIFPNNVLGAPPEQAQQIRLGVIDMGLPTQGQLDKFEKAFAAVLLPFVFDDSQHVFRVLDGPAMAWLAPLAEKQGFDPARQLGIRLPQPHQQSPPHPQAGGRGGAQRSARRPSSRSRRRWRRAVPR